MNCFYFCCHHYLHHLYHCCCHYNQLIMFLSYISSYLQKCLQRLQQFGRALPHSKNETRECVTSGYEREKTNIAMALWERGLCYRHPAIQQPDIRRAKTMVHKFWIKRNKKIKRNCEINMYRHKKQ